MAEKEGKEKAEEKPAKDDKKAANDDIKDDKKADKQDDKKDVKDSKKDAKDDKVAAKDGKKADDAKNAEGDKKNPEAAGKKGKGKAGKTDKAPKEKKKFSFKKMFKKKEKKPKPEKPQVPYVDKPDKPEVPSAYVHKAVKLDKKDNQFSDKKFQDVRKVSSLKRNIDAFRRIGTCLNDVDLSTLPTDCINKVCLILMNTYPKSNEGLGVGPTNDAYLLALIHHKLGYKIAFLINPEMSKFIECLEFFVEKTVFALTIFYSGHDSSSKVRRVGHGLEFLDGRISSTEFGQIVGEKSNGQSKIIIISDVGCGRSVFNMKAATSTENAHCSEIITFSIDKKLLSPKERKRSQGLFTYYFCKLIRQFPNSTPNEMVDMLNISFERFRETFTVISSSNDVNDRPMFIGADVAFNGKKAGNGPKPPTPQAIPANATPTAPAQT